MTAPVVANSSKNTRAADCREDLRCTFVDKFEGYRPQTDAEKAAGTLPANYSYIQVGRGHSDRMEHNPFPEPVPPCTPLRASAYLGIEDALLKSSGEYSPLVEYYRRNETRLCTAVPVLGFSYGDIGHFYLYPVRDSLQRGATPPAVGVLTVFPASGSGKSFFYDSVTEVNTSGAHYWDFSLRTGQYSIANCTDPEDGSYFEIRSAGAVPWTSDEVKELCWTDIGWNAANTAPMFAAGFFYGATEKSFLDAIHARLLPTYLGYTRCSSVSNTLTEVYRYRVCDNGDLVYLRSNAGTFAYAKFPDGIDRPLKADGWEESGGTVQRELIPTPSMLGDVLYSNLGSEAIAKACAYRHATPSDLTANSGVKTMSLPYVFSISCHTSPSDVLSLGGTVNGRWYNSFVTCGAYVTGGWTAPCSGGLYLGLYANMVTSSDAYENLSSPLATKYPLSTYEYMNSQNYSRCRFYPAFNNPVHAFKNQSEDCGAVPSCWRELGIPFTGMLCIPVVTGDTVTFGAAGLAGAEDGFPYTCQISSSDVRYPPWSGCDQWGDEWDEETWPSVSCLQDHKAAAYFVPYDWEDLP